MEQSSGIVRHGLRGKRRLGRCLSRTPVRHGSNADDTYAPLMQPAPCGTTHDKLTLNDPFAFGLLWFCHAPRLLSVTAKPRFKSFRNTDVVGLPRSLPCGRHNRATAQFVSGSAWSLAAASSSLR